MRWMRDHDRSRAVAVALTATVLACGCATGVPARDKACGPGEPVELRMASTYGDLGDLPGIAYFVERVEELSGAMLRIDVVHGWANFAADGEQQVVRSVAGGEVDLGWVPSGVFDTLGVDALRALTAPLLVDSYVLEQAVIDDGITTEMLPAVENVGVVGLAVLADGLRKPIGVDRPIVAPADWRGISFGTSLSDTQADAIRTLGATPVAAFMPGLESGTIQGFELFLYNYSNDGMLAGLAPYVTANVNLWPQMDVLIANPARLAALASDQRAWLEDAARDAAARSPELADLDAEAMAASCAAGARFAEASVAELAGLEAALRPVYADLERDPVTKAFIARIRALKQSLPAGSPLVVPPRCSREGHRQSPEAPGSSADATGAAPASLSGTYRYELTLEDAIANNPDQPDLDEFPSVITVTLNDGRFSMNDGGLTGTYTVDGDRLTFHIVEFETSFAFTFSVDDEGSLHLTPVPPMHPGDAFTFSAKPWKRVP